MYPSQSTRPGYTTPRTRPGYPTLNFVETEGPIGGKMYTEVIMLHIWKI